MSRCVLISIVLCFFDVADGSTLQFGEPYELEGVNTDQVGDFSPALAPNGLELYFFQRGADGNTLRVARRESLSDTFGVPEDISSNFPGAFPGAGHPSMTGDGLTLFFDAPGVGRDIYTTTRPSLGAPWVLLPASAGPGINSIDFDGRPSVSADGLVLVFDRGSDRVGRSLHIAVRSSTDEPFGTAVALDDRFLDGASPGLSPDGLTLFFGRTEITPTGFGGSIWMATRSSRDAPFDDPVRLDETINSHGCVDDPNLSFDGKTLFFIRSSCVGLDEFLSESEIYAAAIVPEPSSLLLACLAMVAATRCRRCR